MLNLSVLDGWWVEAAIEGVNGWSIGQDGGHNGAPGQARGNAQDLYQKLESVVLPLYYNDRGRWIWMMKQSISKIAGYFNTQRMMRRYAARPICGRFDHPLHRGGIFSLYRALKRDGAAGAQRRRPGEGSPSEDPACTALTLPIASRWVPLPLPRFKAR